MIVMMGTRKPLVLCYVRLCVYVFVYLCLCRCPLRVTGIHNPLLRLNSDYTFDIMLWGLWRYWTLVYESTCYIFVFVVVGTLPLCDSKKNPFKVKFFTDPGADFIWRQQDLEQVCIIFNNLYISGPFHLRFTTRFPTCTSFLLALCLILVRQKSAIYLNFLKWMCNEWVSMFCSKGYPYVSFIVCFWLIPDYFT